MSTINRTILSSSLLFLLLTACGGGTEPTIEDLTGLWRVSISRILAPPAEEGFCSVDWTMAIEPSPTSSDTFSTELPATNVVCGSDSRPWGRRGTLLIAKQGTHVTISRPGIYTLADATLHG